MTAYRAVTLGDEDVEWVDPIFGDLHAIVWSDTEFAEWVTEHGTVAATELMHRFHRKIANQLIRRACKDRLQSDWARRTIGLVQRAKKRRREVYRLFAAEFGYPARDELVARLDSRYPRAEWGELA